MLEQVISLLLQMNNKQGHLELIRQFKTFDETCQQRVRTECRLLSDALRQGLKSGDDERITDCLELILSAELFSELPILFELMQTPKISAEEKFVETFSDLISSLNEQQIKKNPAIANAVTKIQQILNNACQQFASLEHQEIVLKSLLILSSPTDITIGQILSQENSPCCQMAIRMLSESKHSGIMQLLIDNFSASYPKLQMIEILRSREDMNFVIHLLRWMPGKPNETTKRNFAQVKSLSWLISTAEQLQTIPQELHEALARLISLLGLPARVKRSLQKWLIQNGSPNARRIATEVLSNMEPEEAQQMIQEGLESEDEETQAWSVGQLRSQNIPNAMQTLIGCLGNDSDLVRDAARNELQGFSLEYVISHIDKMTPDICHKVGTLIQKIDPDVTQKLETDLQHPIYHRRLQTLRAVAPLGMTRLVQHQLYELLEDDEVLIRRIAIETLAQNPSEETLNVLADLVDDPSPRIREIVQQILNNHLPQATTQ